MKKIETDVAVIGAGSAGLSAAYQAAHAGAKVLVIDENRLPGGQLFKQIHKFFGSRAHQAGTRGYMIGRALLEKVEQTGAEVWLNSLVYGMEKDKSLGVIHGGQHYVVKAKKVIVATGAKENYMAFPGSTLPGVMGAGAAQTMVNVNRVLPGQRILMLGSGNVGLIVSYQLMQAGAEVVAVVEGAPKIGGYGVNRVLPGQRILMLGSGNVGLIVSYQLMQAGAEVVAVVEGAPKIGGYGVHAGKIRQRILMLGSGNVGLIVSYQLMQAGAEVVAVVEGAPKIGGYGVHAGKIRRAGVPIYTSHTIKRVRGRDQVEAVEIVEVGPGFVPIPGTKKTFAVDTVCLAVGLNPMTELIWMAGCEFCYIPAFGGHVPLVPIPGTKKTFAVDTVCLAVGLNPMTELIWMAGCEFCYIPAFGGHVPLHDHNMETTVPGLYVAGDVTGVEEASSAMEEGNMAGVSAAEALGLLSAAQAAEKRMEIQERLDTLRSGMFGERRRTAKEEQLKNMDEYRAREVR